MYDKAIRENELLYKLNNDLEQIRILLTGAVPTENCDTKKENKGLDDLMSSNLKLIDNAIVITSIIRDTIEGENK